MSLPSVVDEHFQIRYSQSEDRVAVIQHINQICAERIYYPVAQYTPTPLWELALANGGCHSQWSLLVATSSDEIIGHGRVFPSLEYGVEYKVGNIGIGIKEDCRTCGFGKQILKELISKSREQGYEILTANVFATNKRAVNFFSTMGFLIDHSQTTTCQTNGFNVKELLMRKEIT